MLTEAGGTGGVDQYVHTDGNPPGGVDVVHPERVWRLQVPDGGQLPGSSAKRAVVDMSSVVRVRGSLECVGGCTDPILGYSGR